VHTVDFTGYSLEPGDLLRMRAGQAQQWGIVDDIEGPVFLFTPSAIDIGAQELIRSAGVTTPNHWAAAAVAGTPVAAALDTALAAASTPQPSSVDLRDVSAKQLIDERVVLEAKRLLAHGRNSVAWIAGQLGFDDPSNFSKYFQQRTGTTPAVFRDRVRSSVGSSR
jgi:AraC-like DNA-binding protein